MKTSRLVLILGCCFASILAVVAFAGPGDSLRSFLHGPEGWANHGELHGGPHGGMQRIVAGLVAELDLRPDQQVHIDTIHEILSERVRAHRGGMDDHLGQIIGRIDEGSMNVPEAHAHIDDRLESMRSTAYLVSEELITLIHSLDDTQRDTLTAHLGRAQMRLQHMEELGFFRPDAAAH